MPKRKPAIDDDTLRREVGHLADEVLLLPQQVSLLTGLSVGMLKERMRTQPPKPPHPEPREKERKALWYSLGSVRRYREWLSEQAELNVAISEKKKQDQQLPGFAAWMADASEEAWPVALVGPLKRPVDAWSTIRGEAEMARSDRIEWMTQEEYLAAMGSWVDAARLALDREKSEKRSGKREQQLRARGATFGKPRKRP